MTLRIFLIFVSVLAASPCCFADTRELVARATPAIVLLKNSKGSGTGFFISADGKIVTNYHVVENAGDLKAITSDGRELAIDGVWAVDQANDIAILQAPAGQYTYLSLAPAGPVDQGTRIYVLGHPQGFRLTFSDGLISATRKPEEFKEWVPEAQLSTEDVLQITAPISSGSSGSPVMLENGLVVGVVRSAVTSGQNLNFAVPAGVIHSMLEKLGPDKKLMSLSRAQVVARRQTSWVEIIINLMISFAIFGGCYLAWHYFVARRQ